ncbi:hypothetical protein T492DRAFT_919936 [Pavlovales sp. CCMP2436]|nr:hypothetical protein T492DRAFT_919936 [Pavlovales sp. CCMP2436]
MRRLATSAYLSSLVSIEQYIVRTEMNARHEVSAKTTREPCDIRGTNMNTDTTAHASAHQPPVSSTSSTSSTAGRQSRKDQRAKMMRTTRERMIGAPAQSSFSAARVLSCTSTCSTHSACARRGLARVSTRPPRLLSCSPSYRGAAPGRPGADLRLEDVR